MKPNVPTKLVSDEFRSGQFRENTQAPRALDAKEDVYSHGSSESIDLEKYKKYEEKLRLEFLQEKALKEQRGDNHGKYETEELQGILKSEPPLRNLRSSELSDPLNEKKVRISDVLNVREELRHKGRLEMIEEQSEDDHKRRMYSTQTDRFVKPPPDHLHSRNKSDSFIQMEVDKRDSSIISGANGGNITGRRQINLDESSNLYSMYNKRDDTLKLDKTIDIPRPDINNNILVYRDESKNGISSSDYYGAIGKCSRLEKENEDLKLALKQLKEKYDKCLANKVDPNEVIELKTELAETRKSNVHLESIIFKLQVQLKNQAAQMPHNFGKGHQHQSYDAGLVMQRSKSRDQIYVSQNGLVSPFDRSDYFNHQSSGVEPSRPPTKSISKDQAKKIKFSESVVTMVQGLIASEKEIPLKQAWQLLKKVITEYFAMKSGRRGGRSLSPTRNANNQNLPTAVKNNDVYGDLTKERLNRKQNTMSMTDRFGFSQRNYYLNNIN